MRNRTAEAQLGRSLVEGERIGTQREQLEQTIQVEVRNALQSMRSAESRLRAAVATREANEQQFASEQRKLDAGQSTRFLVLGTTDGVDEARGLELKAQTDLNKAIADLQRATGNALQSEQYRGASALTGFPVLRHLITAGGGFWGRNPPPLSSRFQQAESTKHKLCALRDLKGTNHV